MNTKLRLILFALLLLPGFAAAQDVVVWPCNGCTTQQMKNLAIQKGLGEQYVYNLSGGVLVGYSVTREEWGTVAVGFPPADWMIDQYALVHQYYLNNGKSLASKVSAAPTSATGGSVNGYDVVGSSLDRNRVTNAIASNPRLIFTSTMASYGRVIRLAGIATPDAALTVKVTFPDGSTVIYKFNWNTKQWEYLPKSAIDSHGNSIPETASDFTNGGVGANFDFSGPGNPNDVNDFIQRAAAAGVTITGNTRWACSAAGGNSFRCVPY